MIFSEISSATSPAMVGGGVERRGLKGSRGVKGSVFPLTLSGIGLSKPPGVS